MRLKGRYSEKLKCRKAETPKLQQLVNQRIYKFQHFSVSAFRFFRRGVGQEKLKSRDTERPKLRKLLAKHCSGLPVAASLCRGVSAKSRTGDGDAEWRRGSRRARCRSVVLALVVDREPQQSAVATNVVRVRSQQARSGGFPAAGW